MRHAVPCGLILSTRVPDPVDVHLLWFKCEAGIFIRVVVEANDSLLVDDPLRPSTPVNPCSARLGLKELSLDAFRCLFKELDVLAQQLLKPRLGILVHPGCSNELLFTSKVVAHLEVKILEDVALIVESVTDNFDTGLIYGLDSLEHFEVVIRVVFYFNVKLHDC